MSAGRAAPAVTGFGRRLLAGLVAFGLCLGGGGATAQDAPPDPRIELRAAIRAGTCERLAPEPVAVLGTLGVTQVRPIVEAGPPADAPPTAPADVLGEDWDAILPGSGNVPLPPEILGLEAEADAAPAALFGSPHAIAVSRVGAAGDGVVACGEVAATAPAEDAEESVAGLRPRNGSDYYGYAALDPIADGAADGQGGTTVSVYLFQGLTTAQGTPTAWLAPTPAALPAPTEERTNEEVPR